MTENTRLQSIKRWLWKGEESPLLSADAFSQLYEETYLLRHETPGDRVADSKGILGQAVLIVNFDVLNFGKLLEIVGQDVCNGVIRVGRFAGTGQGEAGDAIGDLELAVPGKSVVNGDPAP